MSDQKSVSGFSEPSISRSRSSIGSKLTIRHIILSVFLFIACFRRTILVDTVTVCYRPDRIRSFQCGCILVVFVYPQNGHIMKGILNVGNGILLFQMMICLWPQAILLPFSSVGSVLLIILIFQNIIFCCNQIAAMVSIPLLNWSGIFIMNWMAGLGQTRDC
jgi:hypothetical protein